MWRGGGTKQWSFCMWLKLNCYQFKIECYNFKIFYAIAMVIIEKISIENTQEKWKKKKESKEINKRNVTTKKKIYETQQKALQEERGDENATHDTENNKMEIVSPSLSVVTLNLNGLNSLIKRHRLDEWMVKKNRILPSIVYMTFVLDLKRHTDWKWNNGKRYSIPMVTRREKWLYNNQAKKTLSQNPW